VYLIHLLQLLTMLRSSPKSSSKSSTKVQSIGLLSLALWSTIAPYAQAIEANPTLTNPASESRALIPRPVQNSVTPSTKTPILPPANDTYRLGSGDHIDINVFDSPEFTGSRVIAPDGTISLPIVGPIPAAGRSPEQLTQDLELKLRRWIKKPVVSIGVTQFRPLLISVAGEVQRPGPLQLRSIPNDIKSDSSVIPSSAPTLTLPTLSAAVTNAGGLTRDADIRQVTLRRGNNSIKIDLWAGLTSDQAQPDYLLQDGDSIFVPKLNPQDVLDRRLLAKSSLAPKTIRVRVVGEVKKPGEVDVAPSSTISSAVAIAGGPTDKARMEEVSLVRLGDDGRIQEQRMDLSKLIDSQQVQDGDVVLVPKSSNSSFLDVVGQVVPPLGILFNLFKK
jgi:polysaccharide biosynthesis/export protein